MTNSKTTKWTLVSSVLTIVMCAAMLMGTTYAWFTGTAKTGVNKIQSGTLQVDIVDESGASLNGSTLNWVKADGTEEILWEPGAEYALTPFKVVNKGTMAFKYKVTISGATGDTQLLDVIDFTLKTADGTTYDLNGWEGILLPAGKTATAGEEVGETGLITLSGKMRTDAGNEYQGLTVDGISITVVALQNVDEAQFPIEVNNANIQDYLDGKYGPINGKTLVLAEGNYDMLTIGGIAAGSKDNITYTCNHTDGTHYSYTTPEEYKEHVADTTVFHYTSTYTRTMNDVTFVADGEVTINGVLITSGHMYQLANPFREGYTGYYLNQELTNITFKGINFAGNVNINTSSENTVFDGFTFDGCTFTTNGTTSDKAQAIRYYNELDNGNVKNLTVKNCKFTNCYQGVYTMKVRNVTVTGCEFDTTGHNAIAIQGENVNHGAVVITDNTFANIGDRIIRFNTVGADTQITINGNTATNSGNSDKEVIKATTLADGITYDIAGNSWGDGTIVGNTEFADR